MFRHRYRRSPFSDFINWTDYRWDAAPRPQAPIQGPWNRPHRQHGFLQLLLAGLAVMLGIRLLSAFRSHRGSWLGRAFFALLLIGAAAAFSSRRSRRW
jgi:hypothetical protein